MEPSLSAALLAERDDPRRWAVYADWLEAQGDPHGTLVSLMLEREARPTRALAKAMKEREQLLSELTPGALRMLVARELPRLAPVFRRGFLWSAGAADDADFTELVNHAACAFLDRALLEPSTGEQLGAWLAQGPSALPWRALHVSVPEGVDALDLSPLISRLPQLASLEVSCAGELTSFTLGEAPALRDVTLLGGSEALLEGVLRAPGLSRLKLGLSSRDRYEPEGADRLEVMARRLTAAMPRFETVILEGAPGEAVEALVDAPARGRLVVRSSEPEELRTAFDPWPAGDETCFVVVRGKLTEAHRQTLTQFAKHAGARRVVATVAEARLGGTNLSLLRLHGEGEMPLVPRAIANQLARGDPALDVAAISLSSSNATAAAWTVGPHAASDGAPARRASAPALRFEASFFSREPLVREALDGLLGFDPGLDVLGVLLDQLDLGTREAWLGEALRSGERLPLFTDLDARRNDEGDEDEERELEGHTDALDDPDEDDDWGGSFDEDAEAPNEWGGEPVIVLEPPPERPEDVRVLPGAHLEDDDPEDDLDPPAPDVYEAREGDVWNDGPVELPEHHDATIGDPIVEPDGELPRVHFDETLQPCDRCRDVKVLRRCQRCGADVCRSCVTGWSLDLLDDDGREFVCVDCVDHPMAQRRVPPERTPRR